MKKTLELINNKINLLKYSILHLLIINNTIKKTYYKYEYLIK